MRKPLATALAALAALAGASAPARAAIASTAAQRALTRTLAAREHAAGHRSGALVVDLTASRVLYAAAPDVPRMPASVEKLYTASAALARFGPSGSLQTSILATGSLGADGTFTGVLYLRGGGDPTFGTSAFDRSAYGAGNGTTIEALVARLLAAVPMRAFAGSVVGDESFLDARRGTAPYGFDAALEIEGELSGIAFNRGFADWQGDSYQPQPARYAAQQLVVALRAAGVQIARGTATAAGTTPPDALPLASVASPPMAALLRLTLAPSDIFLAETLLKDLGARFGSSGSSAAGAAVVRAELASAFRIHPAIEDGSGLSRRDRTTPREVVTVLAALAGDADFTGGLAVVGRSGTLVDRMRHTFAAGRCLGKTGTLSNVSNLAGLCTARDGHRLAFAFLMNAVDPTAAHRLQDAMTVAVARYAG